MARPVPYPPSPAWIPANLLDLGEDTHRDARSVKTALAVFLILYACALLSALGGLVIGVLCLVRFAPCAGLPIVLISGYLSFIMVRVLFYRPGDEKGMEIEVTEEDQPVLFAFLRKLTDEIDAPEPDRVFVTFDVNAAVATKNISLVNLVVPPRRDLHIGLALVNALTLGEFKAVMGHEFGHFAQGTGRMSAYLEVAFRAMAGLKGGETWVSRELKAAGRRGGDGRGLSILFLLAVGGPVWCAARLGELVFRVVHISRFALSRSHEFHADRVAVSVAGSNAIVHSLAKLRFAEECLSETARVLDAASQHKLHSADLYFHHAKSADRLRRVRGDARLGLPPALKSPADGQRVQVFDPDEDDEGPPLMWRTHPRNFDREENAKKVFVPCEDDERSPWILFRNADELRERMTYKFYRAFFRVKKSVELLPAREVQKFIDEENAEVTFDPKYHGAYDERWVSTIPLYELIQGVEKEPWDAGRIARTHARLYRELGDRADDFRRLRKRIREIYRKAYGRPRGKAARRAKDLEAEFDQVIDWFNGFDRRVYMVHAQMAAQLGEAAVKELTDRYYFHLDVQELHLAVVRATQRVEDALHGVQLANESALPKDFFDWVRDSYQLGRKTMGECLLRARQLRTPELASIKAGTRLDTLIFDQEVIAEPPLTYVPAGWVRKLVRQMARMRSRLHRMDFKSLGALLQMQDRLAAEWAERATPAAILVDDEPPAEPK